MSELLGRVEGLIESTETAIGYFEADEYSIGQSHQIIASVLQDAKDVSGFLAQAALKMESIVTALGLESTNSGQNARETAKHASFIGNIVGYADDILGNSSNQHAVEAQEELRNTNSDAATSDSTYTQAHRQIESLVIFATAAQKTVAAAINTATALHNTTDQALPLVSLAGTSAAEAARHGRGAKEKLEAYYSDIQ